MTKLERENAKKIREMEKEITRIYKASQAEIALKYEAFKSEYNLKLAIYDTQIKKAKRDGDAKALAHAEYERERFLKNSMFTDRHYLNMLEQVKAELLNANKTAVAYVNDQMPEVYCINYNGESSLLMKDLQKLTGTQSMGVSWELVNPYTVRNMVRDGTTLLPYKEVNGQKYERWATQKINAQMLRGIIQGESISKLADRLQNVTVMDRNAAIRNARTMHTSAQGKGVLSAMQDGKKKGMLLQKVWEVAIFDGRLRDSHRAIAGEIRELDDKFSNGLMYPGDPDGRPEEVYNCRCTMKHNLQGFQSILPEELQGSIKVTVDGMDSGEWLARAKGTAPKQTAQQAQTPVINPNRLSKADTPKPEPLQDLEQRGVEFRQVGKVGVLTSEQIIKQLAGGDLTKGSCSSLAFAYAGMRAGYDIRDFRGGDSWRFFASNVNIKKIATMQGVDGIIVTDYNEIKTTNNAIKALIDAGKMPKGKEYYLASGRHAAVIRMGEEGVEWLEMQSPYDDHNGWHPMEPGTLRRRFGATKSRTIMGTKLPSDIVLIDIETLGNNPWYEDIMGYINTEESQQKKGSAGSVK